MLLDDREGITASMEAFRDAMLLGDREGITAGVKMYRKLYGINTAHHVLGCVRAFVLIHH